VTDTAAVQLRRILQLIPELADDRDHAIADVARQAGVDRRTLLRDLESLAERYDDPGGFVEGVQILIDPEHVSLRSDHFLRPMRLTIAELGALELGLALLRSERTPEDHGAIDRARERLRKVIARLPDDPPSSDLRAASIGAEAYADALTTIRKAIRERWKLALTYRGSGADGSSQRIVWPYAPAFASGTWYLVAHCERSGSLRVFRLDRVETIALTADRYQVADDFSLDDVVQDGRVFHGAPAERVRIRYGPAVARWIAEREGVPLTADGSLTLEHPLADPHWVVRHVLQYGADAEVLEPPAAREAVRQRLGQMTGIR
jgi:predicted DNA-binding transcriptional regulator YafY